MRTRTSPRSSAAPAYYTNVSRLPLALLAVACAAGWGCAVPADAASDGASAFQDPSTPAMVVPPVDTGTPRIGTRSRARRLVAAEAPHLSGTEPLVYGATLWSSTHGSAGNFDYADAIAVQSTGNVIVAGGFQGTVDVGCGPVTATGTNDVLVASYTSADLCVWSKHFGGSGSETEVVSVSVDATDNIYLSGYFGGQTNFGGGNLASAGGYDGYVAKLSSSGVYTWADSFGGTGDDGAYGAALVSDAVAGPMIVVAGSFSPTATFGATTLTSAGDLDGFVAAYLESTGAYSWAKRFGGTGYDSANAVAYRSNAIVIAGTATGSVDLGNGTPTTAFAGSDVLLGEYDTTGAPVWSKQYGGSGTDDGWAVAVDINGNIHVAGTFQTSGSFGGALPLTGSARHVMFAAQYTSTGAYAWAQALDSGLGGDMSPFAMTVDGIGTTYVAGAFNGTLTNPAGGITSSSGPYDAFLVAFTPSTTLSSVKWLRSYSGPGTEGASGIALSSTGSVLSSGFFDTSINFGAGAVLASGSMDMFLVNASAD